ncbi:hypothetical protein D3C72_2397950 [compost metagenome]
MGDLKVRRGNQYASVPRQHLVQRIEGGAQADEDGGAGDQKLLQCQHQLALHGDLDGVPLIMGVMGDAGGGEGAPEALLQ